MDRSAWLKEKRRLAEVRMDTLFAPTYDAHWGHINDTHRMMLARVLDLCPPGCTILDAACGTGKYRSLILASGRAVRGFDQPAQMLRQAHAKLPEVPTQKMGLYYPSMARVRRWLDEARFALLDEAVGDGYHHFSVVKA